ncbi:GNAT family N-acetyltransferase [uncultured Shewanella sp.]|uniref:GNAT family N-acetyltransferase n=1 Tax=uncultured Shewanella sp. TaxID=173975 RepID=UPI002620DFBA|nr:GNAT family N-acetyltransferase [uncultured Shewanella sp.]
MQQKYAQTQETISPWNTASKTRDDLTPFAADNIDSQIQLRPIQLSDAPRVKDLMTMAISRPLSIAPIHKINEAQDFILGKNSNQNIRLGISHSRHGLIGGISYGFEKATPNQNYVLFSYWLGEAYQRQGHTFNALTLLFNHLRSQGNTDFLAKVYPSNTPSQHLLKKLGFQYNEISTSKDPSTFIHFTRLGPQIP